jgi:hypothetical protein
MMNFVTPKLKNIIITSLSYGFVSGFCVGCFPNKLSVKFDDKKYNSLPIPLISGVICSVGLIFSPLLIINYFCNGMYFDKLIDKYEIDIERYHQYDGKNNKYAFPSLLILSIRTKILKEAIVET